MAAIINGFENMSVTCEADNGRKLLGFLETATQRPDVILMDLSMPVMDGYEATSLIREKDKLIPIVALTAFDKQEVSEQALSCGMNDVIIKPFEQSKLFQIISNMIDKNN